jgi:hypothetical protein
MTIKYTKLSQNIPNGRKIDQMAIKYTNIFHCKIGIFGLKIYHLANLIWSSFYEIVLAKIFV